MAAKYTISLKKIIEVIGLDIEYTPVDTSEILVSSLEINRPGLMLSGFTKYFDPDRIQIMGVSEIEYLNSFKPDERFRKVKRLLSKKPVAIILTRGQEYHDDTIELAQKYGVALLKTTDGTSSCMSTLISYLSVELAPRITRHGVFVEVYGEGVLIMGESGMGKSETALELIKRGHRLVADDAVEIRKVSHKTLVGSAPENIRHFIELRGVGVVNARRLFGIGSVKVSEKINMVIQLEPWNPEKNYERLGLENETMDILGIEVPICVVPVTPGRNISIIIEAAAMNNRQKKMGYNAAKQLLHNLGMTDDIKVEEDELAIWHNF
ncbi:MAG TPA: HPr(Ser) kinase/phosphatase [Ruminococcaceae bacterium]|nr:HPr(Ser) kinase/phosphatase [Oscillospiraceae bacterium]